MHNTDSTIFSPPGPELSFGPGALSKLGRTVKRFEAKHVMIVTDPGVMSAGYPAHAQKLLAEFDIASVVFSQVSENPTASEVKRAAHFARDTGPFDLIVGLGGGSAMDCAKGVNFLITNGGEMSDYRGHTSPKKPLLPSIGIPTTGGTGSEAQSYAIISTDEHHIKMACGAAEARFKAVLLDPLLLQTVPDDVAKATALDALSHSVESFVCTKRNPISVIYSRESWRLISHSIDKILRGDADAKELGEMQLGAYFAGLAIEHSMLGAAHASANPLTARYDMAHGIAVSVMLPHVIRLNARQESERYAELNHIRYSRNGAQQADELDQYVSDLLELAGIANQLSDHGIAQTDLQSLASEAAEQWTGKFNPITMDQADFLKLYKDAY